MHTSAIRYPMRNSSTGFTLVELLITVALLGILITIAIPSFDSVMLNSRLNTFSNSFVSNALLARSEAIKRNAPITLCASADGVNCGGEWENGWIVLNGATVLNRGDGLPNNFRMRGNVTTVIFQPTGVGATLANLTMCRATPSVGPTRRNITIGATGRPDVATAASGAACP